MRDLDHRAVPCVCVCVREKESKRRRETPLVTRNLSAQLKIDFNGKWRSTHMLRGTWAAPSTGLHNPALQTCSLYFSC